LQSLKFSETGLSSFNYKALENELTPTQIYKVLSIFGMQHLTARFRLARVITATDMALITSHDHAKGIIIYDTPEGDYEGYACTSRATCSKNMNDICTSNC
jgi:hypothetical protein